MILSSKRNQPPQSTGGLLDGQTDTRKNVGFNLSFFLLSPRKQESGDGMRSMDLPFVGEDEVLS